VPTPRLYTRSELETLESWSFIKDSERTRKHFAALTIGIHFIAAAVSEKRRPGQRDVATFLATVLEEDEIFGKLIKDKRYIGASDKPVFAKKFAKYIVSEVWAVLP